MKKVRAKKSTIRIREVIAKILIIICLITNINTNYIVLAQDESEKTEIETAIEWLKIIKMKMVLGEVILSS